MSPISSRNRVPPLACSKRPMRCCVAPVKAPFSWPKSSDSSNSRGMAAVFSAMSGWVARGLCRCRARATSSLPVPDSPVMSTVMCERDRRPMARNTSCIAGAAPIMSEVKAAASVPAPAGCVWRRRARRTMPTASSTSKGFGRYSNAPPLNTSTARSRSAYAVMMMTGTSGARRRTCSSSPMPSVPGMRMSARMTAGFSFSSLRMARSALSRQRTGMPACVSAFSSTQRLARSSSTTHTGADSVIVVERQQHAEDGMAGAALAFDGAAVLVDQAAGDRQSEAGAVGASRDHGVEDLVGDLGRHAGAGVDDLHAQGEAVTLAVQGHLPLGARAQRDFTATGHRLAGVVHHVQERLHQMVAIGDQGRQAGVVIAVNPQVGPFGLHQLPDVLEDLVDIQGHGMRLAFRQHHVVQQFAQPVGLAHDEAGVFAVRLAAQLALEQLRRASDAAQRIFHLVGHAAHQGRRGVIPDSASVTSRSTSGSPVFSTLSSAASSTGAPASNCPAGWPTDLRMLTANNASTAALCQHKRAAPSNTMTAVDR